MASIQPNRPKESAYDSKGTVSGYPEPSPERSDVETLSEHGIEINKNQPLQTKSTLDERDQQRWELDPESSAQ